VERWLQDMRADYQLVSRERCAFPRYDKRERRLVTVDHLEIFRFVPHKNPVSLEKPGFSDRL
jgi:hypothetical protein